MSEEQSPELEHILFDHQKALYKHHYGGREATHEKQPGLTLNLCLVMFNAQERSKGSR